MEVIDKAIVNGGVKSIPSISFGVKSVFISKAAVYEFGLSIGSYIHFVYDVDRLYFYTDNDENGAKLSYAGGNKESFSFRSIAIIRELKKRIPKMKEKKAVFPVRLSATKWNNLSLIEVLIHKKVK